MKFNNYTLTARFFPALITLIPIVILNYFFLSQKIASFLSAVGNIKIISNLSISLLFLFLLSQINRFVSKELFEKRFFKDEINKPTTDLLLYSNTSYSLEFKNQLRSKMAGHSGLQLPTFEDEVTNENNCRKILTEAVGFVRLKVGSGKLLLQHNIEYGFVRNLIGGSVIAVLISFCNCILFYFYSYDLLAFKLSAACLFLYLFPIIFSRKLMDSYGLAYAKILFQEYLALEK